MFACGPSLGLSNVTPTPMPSPTGPTGPQIGPLNSMAAGAPVATSSYSYYHVDPHTANNTVQYSNVNGVYCSSGVPQIMVANGDWPTDMVMMNPGCNSGCNMSQHPPSTYSLVPTTQYVQQQYTSPDRQTFPANQSINTTFGIDGSVSRVASSLDMASMEHQVQMMALDTSTGSLVPVSNQQMCQPCAQPNLQSNQPVYQQTNQQMVMALDTSTGSLVPLSGGPGQQGGQPLVQPIFQQPMGQFGYHQPCSYPMNVVYGNAMAPTMNPGYEQTYAMSQQTYAMPGLPAQPQALVLPVGSALERKRAVCHKLHQFNLSRWRPATVRSIVGDIACFVTDAHGSKYVQEQLRLGNRGIVNLVLTEVMHFFNEISCDQYGNFVVQKLIEVCDRRDRMNIAHSVCSTMVNFSHDRYACRVVQKLLKASDANFDYNLKLKMYDSLQGQVVPCSEDQSANHVVQCFMEVLKVDDMAHMVDQFSYRMREMAGTKYGCRVLQKALRDFKDPLKKQLIECVKDNLMPLMMDEFGNYVVQEAVRIGSTAQKKAMFHEGVKGQIVTLGQDKHASNVLERFIEGCDVTMVNCMAQEVLYWPDNQNMCSTHPGVHALLSDQFGNYVVQKLIANSESRFKDMLLREALKHSEELTQYSYGKQILARLDTWASDRTPRLSTSSQQG